MVAFHKQLFRHDPENGLHGDCYRTAVACILGLEPAEVPHVYDGTDDETGVPRMRAWLAERGMALISINFDASVPRAGLLEAAGRASGGLPYLLTGKSRNGCSHVVVCEGEAIIHDPALDNSGIIGPAGDEWWMIEWVVGRV
jgi:hypothetical protein